MIERGTGQKLDDYAQDALFDPLGIERVDWVNGFNGRPSAASGLRLTARGLARIGQVVANDGRWNGRQVVPKVWVDSLYRSHAPADGLGYSRFWWLAAHSPTPVWIGGFGYGGQRLVINKQAGVVVVIFAGNYGTPHAWRISASVIEDYLVPELQ